MKRILNTVVAMAAVLMATAQTGNKSIDNGLTAYTDAMKAGKYYDALLKLQVLKNQTDSLVCLQLAEALPKEIAEWTLRKNNGLVSQPTGPMANSGSAPDGIVMMTRSYKNKNDKGDSVAAQQPNMGMDMHMGPMGDGGMFSKGITISISNNMMDLTNFINSYSEAGGAKGPAALGPGSTKSIRIKGYRALVTDNPMVHTYEVTIIAGAAVIRITGQMLDDNNLVHKLADAIDYAKVKAILGE